MGEEKEGGIEGGRRRKEAKVEGMEGRRGKEGGREGGRKRSSETMCMLTTSSDQYTWMFGRRDGWKEGRREGGRIRKRRNRNEREEKEGKDNKIYVKLWNFS